MPKICNILPLSDGCPNHCNGNGKCRRSNGKYSCKCNELFFGESCNYRTEAVCDDGLDNDNDGLADCLDPDCCSSTHCQANPLCMTTSTNQTRPKTSTRSSQDFFDKMNYLIQPGSAQRYADHKAFKRSLFSVLKMKIVDEKAGPLMGMRVVNEMKPKQGFTLTNEAGEAELAVNGGGYVQLSLLRHPFGLLHYNLFVPANQLLDLGTLSISQLQHPSSYNSTSKCAEKLAENPMKIRIFNDFSQFSEVIPDNFDMKIENEISLSYSDKGSVLIFKWEEKSLENVENVLMKISAAGRVFEFDLKPRKEFVFEFDGENEHGEKVEGAVDALDIAFDKRGNLLFLDSNALFYIENSLIHLLGQFSSLSFSTKCLKTFALKDLGLHSAQRILIDPLTGHLILLDKNALIYRIDIHNQIAHRIYNGLHDCGQNSEASRIHSVNHIEIDVNSNNLIVFGFLKNGELTVQSVDLNSDEISTIVKDLRRCKCLKVGCKCSEEESKNDAYAVTSVSVGGKGQILFTTSNPFGIFKLSPLEIFFDKSLATFTITLPNSSEFHTFDRNGRLLSTVKSTTLQRKREFRRELSEKSAKTDLILASGEHLSVTQEAPNKWSITHGNGRRMEVQVHEGVVEIREDGKLIKKMEFTVNGRLLRTDLDEIL
uniref:EGF-like domain-containing protein n=1 Tax=Bursaphelenchus xylophilus TaxID=6326 RepID=A0A1I7RQR8_BURXY